MLKFNVRGQSLSRVDRFRPVEKSINYLTAEFFFITDEWEGLRKRLICRNCKTGEEYNTFLTDDKCIIPWEAIDNDGAFEMSIVGTKENFSITTSVESIGIGRTLVGGLATNPPSPTEVEQILNEIDELKNGALPQLVHEALTEAKEGGEFDGKDGKDGLTPHIGDNGNWWIGETDTGVNASGGVSSWNNLSDRPFYTEKGKVTDIFPEAVLEGTDDGYLLPQMNLVTGETYTVVIDDKSYNCVCNEQFVDGMTARYLGDAYTFTDGMLGTEATGEPFVILDYGSEMIPGVYGILATEGLMNGVTDPVTLHISIDSDIIHKLDNKYLDLEWIPISEIKTILDTVEIDATTEVTNSLTGEVTYEGAITFSETPELVGGTPVITEINGIKFEAEIYDATSILPGYYIIISRGTDPLGDSANDAMLGGKYIVTVTNDTILHISSPTSGIYTLKIYTKNINKIPEKFLPDGLTGGGVDAEGAQILFVTLSDDMTTASHSASEIYAHIQSGGLAFINFMDQALMPYFLYSEDGAIFGFTASANGYTQSLSFLVGEDKSVTPMEADLVTRDQLNAAIPTQLPNPKDLTINGTSYNGSTSVNISIPSGKDGADGKDGKDGADGKDGLTPYIGTNGNWWIGDTDTGVTAGGSGGDNLSLGNFETVFDVELTEEATFAMDNIDISKREYIFYIALPKVEQTVSMTNSHILGNRSGIYYTSLGNTSYIRLYAFHFVKINDTKTIVYRIQHSQSGIDGSKFSNTTIAMEGFISSDLESSIYIAGTCPVGTQFRLEAR